MDFSATYSPDDNKLRLTSAFRFGDELRARIKAEGFRWAPRQQIWVAPMWTPSREDLCIELAGEIDDEDTSLTDRAEERAERFEGYSENRAKDADAAHAGVERITSGIPLGQPILVGHHSERRARKDAERIDAGMRKAVKMWETSRYWISRAKGAIRAAKYKEQPDVRARRIKRIEADKRKQERMRQDAEKAARLWASVVEKNASQELATAVAGRSCGGYDVYTGLRAGTLTPAQAAEKVQAQSARMIAWCDRWLTHYNNRLAYERAMLGDAGGIPADRFDIKPGGRVLVRGEWSTVIRVTTQDGKPISVSTNARFVRVKGIEEVQGYEPPTEESVAAVKRATKARLAPIINTPEGAELTMTAAEWKKCPGDYKSIRPVKATADHGAYRYRSTFRPGGSFTLATVYLSDKKRVDVPGPQASETDAPIPEPPRRSLSGVSTGPKAPSATEPPFEAMRQHLANGGTQTISAPQLFPTPPDLARRMVELADIRPGDRVLEPSFGTGAILDAIYPYRDRCRIIGVEINDALASAALSRFATPNVFLYRNNFLDMTPGELGAPFDAVVMNPPFSKAQDVIHIQRAWDLLKPGGVLVALCANGPKQAPMLAAFCEIGGTVEALPSGTFDGTGVRAALLAVRKDVAAAQVAV